MEKYILGLDVGTTSIGSAIVRCNDNKKPIGLIALHNRIFQEMVEADTRVPKNKKRREKRGARKLVRRYKLRRAKLIQLLIENKMLPDSMRDMGNWESVLNGIGDPFLLRAKGINEPLSPHEFGRVLMHLLRRRGYRSNRGAKYIELMKHPKVVELSKPEKEGDDKIDGENKDKADEFKLVSNGIEQLKKEMKIKNCKTLGKFIYMVSQEFKHEPLRITKLKMNGITMYANRKMYAEEFNALWDKQKQFLPLSDGLKASIHDAIFTQRPMKIQKNRVGKCSLDIHKPRAAKAMLESQEFRMLQEINDLKVKLPYTPFIFLTQEQRTKLLSAIDNLNNLNEKGQLTWADVKKVLGLDKKAKFNLQETSKNGLSGNRTNLILSKTVPEHWKKFRLQQKQALITDLLTIHDKKALFRRLINEHNHANNPWRFSSEEAYNLATLELEPGYAKHCLKVINKLLLYMRDGKSYHDAKENYKNENMKKYSIQINQNTILPLPPNVANPIVQKALYETRRVVNAILKTYGMPQIIRIELARDLKVSKEHRQKIQEQQRKNQKRNEDAEKEIKQWAKTHPEYGITLENQNYASSGDILKYKLWCELGGDSLCPYCNSETPISPQMLFSGEVEIDHIFPLSRSHDDSYLNKVLCHASCNRAKGQQTPYEAWSNTDRFKQILIRLEKLEKQKAFDPRKLVRIKETRFDGDGFVAAQLNDTRYISVAVKNYLEQLGIPVQISTGKATATVRKFLGLNSILQKKISTPKSDVEFAVEVEDDEGQNKKSGTKKRDDHRHHAIDALVTALTDKRLLDEITKRYQYFEKTGKKPDEKLEKICYWNNLRDDVKNILMQSVVSFAVNHKVSGELHKEMPFGASYYLDDVAVRRLKHKVIYAEPDSPNTESWIFEKDARELIRSWWEANKNALKKDRKQFFLKEDGTPLETVKIANRCYVKRKPVKDILEYVANDPGRKTWIVDAGVRNVLAEWLKIPGNDSKRAEQNPPLMPNNKKKKRDKPNPIKTVRIATKFNHSSIRCIRQVHFFELGSNHHVAIFRHKKTAEREGRFITMLDAASRVGRPPVIKIDYPEFDPSEWKFEMFLCKNDMVEFDISDSRVAKYLNLGKSFYRLEDMSGSDDSLYFRHHTVTKTGRKCRYGAIQCKPQTMPQGCKKIIVDCLGNIAI